MAKQVLNNNVLWGEQRGKINDNFTELYNALTGVNAQLTVANLTERNGLLIDKIGIQVFVTDDGDGKWALYRANQVGTSSNFTKLSDPDLLNAVMSNAAIKAAYESNADTYALTNELIMRWDAKQNALTLKTLNGESIVGTGNIVVVGTETPDATSTVAGKVKVEGNAGEGAATVYSRERTNTLFVTKQLGQTLISEEERTKWNGASIGSDLGLLKTTDTPPPTGSHKGDVNSAGTYTNFKDASSVAISFTAPELVDNYGFIYVKDNVATKSLVAKKGGSGKIEAWTAQVYASGEQILKDGVLFQSNSATIATDVPGYSTKWTDLTLWNVDKSYNILENKYVERNKTLKSDGSLQASTTYNIAYKVPVIPNEEYYAVGVGLRTIYKYDALGVFINTVVNGMPSTSGFVTIPSDTYFISYLLVNNPSGVDSADLSGVMLAKSKVVLPYITPTLPKGLSNFEFKKDADLNRNINKTLYLNQNKYFNLIRDISISGGSFPETTTDEYLLSCGIDQVSRIKDSPNSFGISATKVLSNLKIKDNYVYVSMFLKTDNNTYTPKINTSSITYYETSGGALKEAVLIRSKVTKIKDFLYRCDYVGRVETDVSTINVRMLLSSTITQGFNFYISNIAYCICPELYNVDTLLPVLDNQNKTVAEALKMQSGNLNYVEKSLTSKKWTLYGTSVEASNYFQKVADIYNANYINFGNSGGGICWTDDPVIGNEIWNIPTGASPRKAFSATWAEKEAYLIAQGIPYTEPDRKDCFDQNMLLNLDSDLFIIGTLGGNDRRSGDSRQFVIDKTTRKYDRTTIYGAYCYVLRKLFEAKPTARVALLGMHSFGWTDFDKVNEIIREVAKDWCLPFADWGYKMGMSNEVITIGGVDKTVNTASYAPDGAHVEPLGKDIMAEFLIRWLREVI